MRSPERNRESSGKSGLIKGAAVALALSGAGAWVGAEPLAKHLIGDPPQAPEAPVAPVKPQPKPAKRAAMEIAIGFDTTRSQIMAQLPEVTKATGQFLQDTKVLADGDKIVVCTFAENAKCQDFTIPNGKNDLVNHVNGIQVEKPRANMQTHVHNSITQITGKVKGEGSMALAWTDAAEEKRGPKEPFSQNHPPVIIVVPTEGYVANANSVKTDLGTSGVDVAVIKDSRQFGVLLESFTGKLAKDADEKAKRAADAEYESLLAGHAKKEEKFEADKKEHEKKIEKYEAEKQEAAAKIDAVKTAVKIAGGSMAGLAASALGLLLYLRNRPRLKGWILDLNGEYPDIHRIPPQTKEISLNKVSGKLPGNISLKPARDGVYTGSTRLRNGHALAPKILWFESEPDEETIESAKRRESPSIDN